MFALHITPSEREILGWLATGAANDDIARRLGMEEPEVDACLLRLFARMGVRTRTEAIVSAMRRGLVDAGRLIDVGRPVVGSGGIRRREGRHPRPRRTP